MANQSTVDAPTRPHVFAVDDKGVRRCMLCKVPEAGHTSPWCWPPLKYGKVEK